MRKVIRPHDVVLAPMFQILAANVIVEEAGKDLILDEAARITGDRWRILFLETIVIIIPLLKHPWHPAALVFNPDQLEVGGSCDYSVKKYLENRVFNKNNHLI